MALYRYVASKDELLALMVDAAIGPPPPPPPGTTGWRDGLTHWAWAALERLLRSRWIIRVPIPAPPITPNQVRWMEAALTHLRGTALTESEKLSTILLVSGLARSQAAMAADLLDTLDRTGGTDPSAGYGQALAHLTDPAEFPAVHAAVLSGSLDDDEAGDTGETGETGQSGDTGETGHTGDFARDELRFGLEIVLDGLAALVERRAAGHG